MAEKAKPKAAKVKAAKSAATKSPAKTTKTGKAAKSSKGKVKAVKPAARGASAGEPETMQVETFHVLLAPLPGLIHSARPQMGAESIEFSSFEDAKDRAIDHLIELIEEAEHQLHALRRASSHEEFGR